MPFEQKRYSPLSSVPSNTCSIPQASVVICTRNRPSSLRQCLEAVRKLVCQPQEVLIVDNSEGDLETKELAQEFGVRYVIAPIPGLSRARNQGLAEARADVVAFLDDDAVPSPDWLGEILQAFIDDQVAAASGRIVTPMVNQGNNLADLPRTLSKQDPLWLEIASFGGMGLGSNMALRKKASDRTNLFDERLGRGGPFQIAEEHYAFAYLVSRGYSIRYLPEAIVYHPALSRAPISVEARNSIAYFLLLLAEFPSQRGNLIRFLFRRLQKKHLTWARDIQEPGDLLSSGWRIKLKAAFSGLWLYLKTPKYSKY